MHCDICGAEIKEVIVCDIVEVNGQYHYAELVAPILFSEDFDLKSGKIFDYEFYKKELAKKYLCSIEEISSKYIDGIEISASVYNQLDKKENELGCRCPICEDFM